jgi:hypothetical protein
MSSSRMTQAQRRRRRLRRKVFCGYIVDVCVLRVYVCIYLRATRRRLARQPAAVVGEKFTFNNNSNNNNNNTTRGRV